MKCRACQEPINEGAYLCNICKSYQNWRRYLNFSGIVLALLVALISVVSATLPALLKAIETPQSEIYLRPFFRSFNFKHGRPVLSVIASNKGNAPASLVECELYPVHIAHDSLRYRVAPLDITPDKYTSALIGPGENMEASLVSFDSTSVKLSWFNEGTLASNCTVIEFNGNKTVYRYKYLVSANKFNLESKETIE